MLPSQHPYDVVALSPERYSGLRQTAGGQRAVNFKGANQATKEFGLRGLAGTGR